jgi:hypothetical protein
MSATSQRNDLTVVNLAVTGSLVVEGDITLTDDMSLDAATNTTAAITTANVTTLNSAHLDCNATGVSFYGASPAAKQTGVAVTAEAIHAALVALGLIGA